MSPERRPGRFIVLEGGEGSGKSTQARRLAEALDAVCTREPGGSELGGALRELLLDPNRPRPAERTEALLMAADRAQHVAEVILPALESGRHVVSDRHVGSSLAYQAHGRGLPRDEILSLSAFACQGLQPDIVVLLEVAPTVAAARRAGSPDDRLEALGADFHDRVADGYRVEADADPTWVIVDGDGSEDDVAARVLEVVSDRLGL